MSEVKCTSIVSDQNKKETTKHGKLTRVVPSASFSDMMTNVYSNRCVVIDVLSKLSHMVM